jgi:hypothetical protein
MHTFPVSPVAPERGRLPTIEQGECLRGRGFFAIEAASPAPAPYLDCQHIHGLVIAAHRAFSVLIARKALPVGELGRAAAPTVPR